MALARLPLVAATVCALVFLLAAPATHARALVYCAESSPEGFDPGLWDSIGTHNTTAQLFQGLVDFEPGSTKLRPALADSWIISPDARTFVFHLRQGVHFHTTAYFTPTREFNADDVMFTFGRFLHPKHPFNLAFPATFIYPQNLGLADMVVALDKIDDHTVRFTLKEPNVAFLSYFAMNFAGIQSAEYGAKLLLEGKASRINNYPIGTGPYRFKSYKKDEVVRMEANPDYWRGKQLTDKLIYAIAPDPNVRVNKLLAGECQVLSTVRDADIPVLAKRPNIVLRKIQGLNISYLSFNMKHAATSKREVREALDIAIDRNAIFKALFPRGDAVQAVGPFPSIVPGFNKNLTNEYNPERAKQLLAKAGYGKGLELDLWALPVVRPMNPNGQLLAQLIQQDWAKIGATANIKTYEWGEYLKRARVGEHDVYMSGWSSDTGDADDFLSPNLTSAANRPGCYKFCNAEFDKLVDTARMTTDQDKRVKLYEKALEIFKRERPWITLAHSAIYIPMTNDVKGFVMSPNGGVIFENVYR
ncbi:MAG: ABC transporter substrate-binding protein [Burkholderiaceae bacterium]|nr:ABC transporter substrate-binding protein [Burkholderiaceae bacterium]